MGINKIWNKKAKGIISAILLGFSICLQKIVDKITTILFCNNISSCGKNVYVTRGVVYRYPDKIHLGSNIIIGKNVDFSSEDLAERVLKVKNGVSIGDNCKIDFTGGVLLESYVHLAHNVKITTHDHGYDYRNTPQGKSLTIGQNSFIGSDVIILFNCNKIGKNAVIGTGSIVTKDVPDNAIVAGNPARIIKYREDIKIT